MRWPAIVYKIIFERIDTGETRALIEQTKADGWPRWRFLAFSVSYAGFGASVFGLVVHLPGADLALLLSLAGVILFDRRQHRTGG